MTVEFPIRGTLNGVAIVIIPEADYVGGALNEADPNDVQVDPSIARLVDKLRPFGGPRSPIDLDRPVALFLAQAGLHMRIAEAHKACLDKFGSDRTPSPSAISRYWKRLRGD